MTNPSLFEPVYITSGRYYKWDTDMKSKYRLVCPAWCHSSNIGSFRVQTFPHEGSPSQRSIFFSGWEIPNSHGESLDENGTYFIAFSLSPNPDLENASLNLQIWMNIYRLDLYDVCKTYTILKAESYLHVLFFVECLWFFNDKWWSYLFIFQPPFAKHISSGNSIRIAVAMAWF